MIHIAAKEGRLIAEYEVLICATNQPALLTSPTLDREQDLNFLLHLINFGKGWRKIEAM